MAQDGDLGARNTGRILPRGSASRDTAILGGLALVLFVAADMLNLHEILERWIGADILERYQIDELFMVFTVLGFALVAFAFRRWGEARELIVRYSDAEERARESQERLHQILRELPVAVLVRNADGTLAYQNDLAVELFGSTGASASPQHSIIGAYLYRAGSSELYPEEALPDVRALKGERAALDDIDAQHGTERKNLHSLALPILDSFGHIAQAVVVTNDVTQQRRADASLHDTAERLATTVATLTRQTADLTAMSEMVHLLQLCPTLQDAYSVIPQCVQRLLPDASGVVYILDPSRTMLEVATSWGQDEAAAEVFKPDDCWAVRRGQPHVVEDSQSALVCPHVEHVPDGGYVCVPLKARGESIGILHVRALQRGLARGLGPGGMASADGVGVPVALVGDQLGLALSNLRLWDTLRTQSIRDPLTGLYNRRFMEDAFERELYRARRGHLSVGCAMLDLDHFKQFNDAFGHQAGDALLRELGNLLRSLSRRDDIVSRYGGEEFVWILPEASRDEIMQRAEQFRAAVESLAVKHLGRGLGRMTVSIGVAMFPEHGETVEALVRHADLALYKAKGRGRNCVEAAAA